MPRFDIWGKFGFLDNPYSQDTLPATDVGSRLLAGRNSQIGEAQMLIGSRGSTPTFEGPIGAGKTSLLNVAIYRMYEECLEEQDKSLWLPAVETIQPRLNADEFEAEAYRIVLQTLIKHKADFFRVGLGELDLTRLDTWLNAAEYRSWTGGGGFATIAVNAGGGHEPNTSEGFVRSGFPAAIRSLLADAYSGGSGGVVCILDNLEILGQVGQAREQLGVLRDRVLNVPGIRWVLCGSRGTVSRARAQRLSGVFKAPELIRPLTESEAIDAVELRIKEYGATMSIPPLTPEAFRFLYRVLDRNMRDAMNWAQSFSHWLLAQYPQLNFPESDDRDELLKIWLTEQAEVAVSTAGQIQPRVWQFLDDLCRRGGRAGSSELEEKFGFEHQQQGTTAVTQLSSANLVVREADPEDGTRTINSVTADGWLVYFYRSGFSSAFSKSRNGGS